MSAMQTNSGTANPPGGRRARRVRRGVVKATGRSKTIRVECPFTYMHAKYGKLLKSTTSLHVHDPDHQAKLGDHVEIVECRPISKTKRWRLMKVISSS